MGVMFGIGFLLMVLGASAVDGSIFTAAAVMLVGVLMMLPAIIEMNRKEAVQ